MGENLAVPAILPRPDRCHSHGLVLIPTAAAERPSLTLPGPGPARRLRVKGAQSNTLVTCLAPHPRRRSRPRGRGLKGQAGPPARYLPSPLRPRPHPLGGGAPGPISPVAGAAALSGGGTVRRRSWLPGLRWGSPVKAAVGPPLRSGKSGSAAERPREAREAGTTNAERSRRGEAFAARRLRQTTEALCASCFPVPRLGPVQSAAL